MQAVGWLVISIMLAGCGGWRMRAQAPVSNPVPSKYQFDYTVTNAAPISLLRVFDDGGSTYFQFRSNPPEALVISAETTTGEAVIPHERMGNYALIRGVYRQSSIASANQPVVARKLGDIAPMANMGPVVLPKPLQQAAVPVKAEPVPVVGDETATRSALTNTIRFARNSAQLGPRGKDDLAAVLAEAGRAAEIEVRVRPFYPNRPASVSLAEARAAAIRRALSAAGVDALRIRIDTQAAAQPLIAEVVLRTAEQRSDQPSTATIVSAGPLLQAAEHRPSRPTMVATHLTAGAIQ
jgi:outer membrane protein OmpA-like peptidoglycan-associated protein